MKFVGIDIASAEHSVAVVGVEGGVISKPFTITEDKAGYDKLLEVLGDPEGVALVAFEASGHYWQNLLVALSAARYRVCLLNPIRTRRHAQSDLQRTKTDAIDAIGIARFAAEKKPRPTPVPDAALQELRELVRLRDRLVQDMTDHERQLHRAVDLTFPEFKRFFPDLSTGLATTILKALPTAKSYESATARYISKLKSPSGRKVDAELAKELIAAAKVSVGAHHGPAYRAQVEYACEDIEVLRARIKKLAEDIDSTVSRHEIAKLLTTIDGIGPNTAARLVAEIGDFSRFETSAQLAAYVGVIPALSHSGKRRPSAAGISRIGHRELRRALWMPTLAAVRENEWLRAYYLRLRGNGKPARVALIASMRKLLCAIHSVARNQKPFVPHLTPKAA